MKLCSFESQLAIQDDGAFVEGGGCPSTRYIRNWCTSTGKAGLRWDGMYSTNVTGVCTQLFWHSLHLSHNIRTCVVRTARLV